MAWYIVKTFPSSERTFEKDLRLLMQEEEYSRYIFDVRIPMEIVETLGKNKKKQRRERIIWPNYVLMQADISRANWRDLASRLRSLSGFHSVVGASASTLPNPLETNEANNILSFIEGNKEKILVQYNFYPGQEVRIISGPFVRFQGLINEMETDKKKLKVMVQIFGRNVPVEVDFDQVERI